MRTAEQERKEKLGKSRNTWTTINAVSAILVSQIRKIPYELSDTDTVSLIME